MCKAKVADFRDYIGDINLKYGGVFYDLSDWRYGYASFLEVIDLDSAAGVDNCVLVQHGTVIIDDKEKVKDGLRCCGQTFADLPKDAHARKLMIADCVRCYGYYDADDCANVLIWQPFDDDDETPDADSWRAELVKLPDDQGVFEYLYNNGYLADFE